MGATLIQDVFTSQLREFDKIIEGYPEIEKVREKLDALIFKAGQNNEFTFWQKDAVIARCKGIYVFKTQEKFMKIFIHNFIYNCLE